MGDYMRPSDWDIKFKITPKGRTLLRHYSPTRTFLASLFKVKGFATLVLHYIDKGHTNRWISAKVGDSIRAARAITYLLNRGYIRR